MNYYLARDGQTYGPYPEASFSNMLQAGEVCREYFVCPEGGSSWTAVTQVPALQAFFPTAAAAPAAAPMEAPSPGKLRVAAVAPAPRPQTPPMAAPAPRPNPTFSAPVHRTSRMEKLGSA